MPPYALLQRRTMASYGTMALTYQQMLAYTGSPFAAQVILAWWYLQALAAYGVRLDAHGGLTHEPV